MYFEGTDIVLDNPTSKVLSHVCANNMPFYVKNSNKFDFSSKSLVYSKFLLYLCSRFEIY